MISDSLSCLGRYLGIHPALDTAIRWLGANDLNALPTGCTEVDGRTVYINVMDAGRRHHPPRRDHRPLHRGHQGLEMI